MKFFITGLHASGKQEILKYLEGYGVKCGKLFTNLEELTDDVYNFKNYECYTIEDINDIFENNAYIFIQDLPQSGLNFRSVRYYEGLSYHEFDNNDVFVLSPDQLISIPPKTINEEICFIWVDNTKDNRSARYHREHRTYNYNDRETYERKDLGSYVKALYGFENSHVLYFNDEIPIRIATIIYNLIKHPDMFELFTKNFD